MGWKWTRLFAVLATMLATPAGAVSLVTTVNGQSTKTVAIGQELTANAKNPSTSTCDWTFGGDEIALAVAGDQPVVIFPDTPGQVPLVVVCQSATGTSAGKATATITVVAGTTTTTIPGAAPPAAAPDDSAAPVRVDPCDVSLAVKGGADYRMFRGHTATQRDRDVMERGLLGIMMPEVWRYVRSMPGCSGMLGFGRTQLSVVLQRLTASHQYDAIFPDRKTWDITVGGRHYQIEYYVNQKARACSLGSSTKAACAKNPNLTDRVKKVLDIRVENGVCVAGGDCVPPVPTEAYQSAKSKIGMADSTKPMPKPTEGADLTSLHAAHEAHRLASYGLCGGSGQPACVNVQDAHKAYEAFAKDPADAHFRRMMDFSGYADSVANGNPKGWTDAQVRQLKAAQDREHEGWMAAQEAGDWGLARCHDDAHQKFHICENVKEDLFMFRFPVCDGSYPDKAPIESCATYLQRHPMADPGMPN